MSSRKNAALPWKASLRVGGSTLFSQRVPPEWCVLHVITLARHVSRVWTRQRGLHAVERDSHGHRNGNKHYTFTDLIEIFQAIQRLLSGLRESFDIRFALPA